MQESPPSPTIDEFVEVKAVTARSGQGPVKVYDFEFYPDQVHEDSSNYVNGKRQHQGVVNALMERIRQDGHTFAQVVQDDKYRQESAFDQLGDDLYRTPWGFIRRLPHQGLEDISQVIVMGATAEGGLSITVQQNVRSGFLEHVHRYVIDLAERGVKLKSQQ